MEEKECVSRGSYGSNSRSVLRHQVVPRIVDLIHRWIGRHLHTSPTRIAVVAVVLAHSTRVHCDYLLLLRMLLCLMAGVVLLVLEVVYVRLRLLLDGVRVVGDLLGLWVWLL